MVVIVVSLSIRVSLRYNGVGLLIVESIIVFYLDFNILVIIIEVDEVDLEDDDDEDY